MDRVETSGSTSDGGVAEPPPASCLSSPQIGIDPFASEPGCATYYGEFEPRDVVVRIVNRTDTALLVPSHTSGPDLPARHFDVEGRMGGRELRSVAAGCAIDWPSCAVWSDSPTACELIFVTYPSIALEPGGWYEQTWRAWVVADVTLPPDCYTSDEDEVACKAPVDVGAGAFELTARAGVLDGVEPCCQPDPRGSCEVSPLACTRELTRTAIATYDGVCETVEIAFEP